MPSRVRFTAQLLVIVSSHVGGIDAPTRELALVNRHFAPLASNVTRVWSGRAAALSERLRLIVRIVRPAAGW